MHGRYFTKPFRSPEDLMRIYRMAYEKARYMTDVDDKLLAYNEVINYCADSKLCMADESVKRNQILFWTYNNIGDMFIARNDKELSTDNFSYAMQYYRNALEFGGNTQDKQNTLEKMAYIYRELQDEDGLLHVYEQMAQEEKNEEKRRAYTELAQNTDNLKLQAKYLETALNFVMEENVSVLNKCRNTLEICHRLLNIYEHTKNKKAYDRIKDLQRKTLELLN